MKIKIRNKVENLQENSEDEISTKNDMNPKQLEHYNILSEIAEQKGYKLIDNYTNSTTPINFICSKNHNFTMRSNDFKNGHECPQCKIKTRNTPEQAKQNFYSLVEERGYTLLGEYVKAKIKVKLECPNSHIIEISPDHFKRNRNCAKCMHLCPIQAKENYYALAKERNFEIMGEYVNADELTQMKCPNGHIIYLTPKDFKRGRSCRKCSGICPIQAKEDFHKMAEERNFEILGKYVTAKINVKMRCPNNHIFEIMPDKFKSGQACRVCKLSGIAIRIMQILDDNNVEYELDI